MVASSHGRPVTKQSSMVKHLLHGRSRDHILELGANTALRQGTANTARRARRRLQGEMRTGVALASDMCGCVSRRWPRVNVVRQPCNRAVGGVKSGQEKVNKACAVFIRRPVPSWRNFGLPAPARPHLCVGWPAARRVARPQLHVRVPSMRTDGTFE